MRPCHACGHDLDIVGAVGKRESCPKCAADVHVCANCISFDPTAVRGQCRDLAAEPPRDKTAANSCDFFVLRHGAWTPPDESPAAQARAALEALFRKR